MDKNEKLEQMRHSLAHLLAAAVLDLYPGTRNAIGPAIDNGFYYDFDFVDADSRGTNAEKRGPSDSDLPKIEKRMREILPSWKEFQRKEISSQEAQELFAGNPYKLELIEEYKDVGLTTYTSGNFMDLCRGGHDLDIDPEAFKLTHIAGAYWRGDEHNKMLTRIYGLAFDTKSELDDYLKLQEEAEKRDHKKLGRELGLFTYSELVGAGLPLFTPKGTVLRTVLENFIQKLNEEHGYQKVWIPHLGKPELYKTSGHWDKFADNLFHVKGANDEFVLKPMNCPHHTQIYAAQARSYKDLPVRLNETTTIYRDEKSGQLGGLTRVRAITQDDGHVFLRPDQIEKEFDIILAMQKKLLDAVGLKDYRIMLSLRDPKNKEAYLGDDSVWKEAQNTMRKILQERKIEFKEVEGEAAFYGPKMDLMIKDSIGREWQLSTVQLDFNMPGRFGLEYTDRDGAKKTPIMIHRAFMGSTERFIGVLIEHYTGAFPTWLSPVQARILPISEKQNEYANRVFEQLKNTGVRCELDDSNETLGKKIRSAKLQKIPYLLVLGDKEASANTVKVESRDKGDMGTMQIEKFAELIPSENK